MNKESIKDISLRMFEAGQNDYPESQKGILFESYWQVENAILNKSKNTGVSEMKVRFDTKCSPFHSKTEDTETR